jgi:hypothetical protein
LSTDTFTNSDSQHATEVEPGIFASGSTIVTALQIGRRFNGGASDIGFATSTNAGTSWTNGVLPGLTVSVGGTYLAASDPSVTFDKAHGVDHAVGGNMRTGSLPSAAVDATGRVYVVWQDCRFRAACSSNDIVLSTSPDGNNWTAAVGIPIDAMTSTVDHFIPAFAVDQATSGGSVRLALTYYFYPVAQCSILNCQLNFGFVSSQDGGNSWSGATTVAGPMSLSWLPNTSSGVMVGDYTAIAFSNSQA